MSKQLKNEYLIVFGFLSKEQMLKFVKEKSGQYDIMKLRKVGDDYIDLIADYNCRYWAISKLYGFEFYTVALDEMEV
jgi:hypothetical protein